MYSLLEPMERLIKIISRELHVPLSEGMKAPAHLVGATLWVKDCKTLHFSALRLERSDMMTRGQVSHLPL